MISLLSAFVWAPTWRIATVVKAKVTWVKTKNHCLTAAFVENLSLDVRERKSMAITLNIHAKSNTVRGRPTLKLVERFGNRSVREIYERSFTSEPSIEKYQAKPARVNTTVYLDGIEKPVEYQKLL